MTSSPRTNAIGFWGSLAALGLCLATLTWVPLFYGVGIEIELSNLIQLLFILLLPAVLVFSRGAPEVHLLFLLLIAWSLVVLLALALHGSGDGTGIVRMQIVQALFGWSLALCIANSGTNISRVALVGLIILLVALEYSATTAGYSLTLGALDFVQNMNRNQFIYQVVRPALNVFTGQEDLVFVASEINNVTNNLVLLACLIFFRRPGEQGPLEVILGSLVSALALMLAFVIFSTSAVVVVAIFLLASLLRSTGRLSPQLRLLTLLVVAALAMLLYEPVNRFMALNLGEDAESREARIEQFDYAFNAINSRILTGVGFSDAGGHVIHNWPLFSWTTAGVLAFLLVLAVYLTVLLIGYNLVRRAPSGSPVVLALLTMFFVRTFVGGAGGIPSGPSMIALAVLAGLSMRRGTEAAQFRPASADLPPPRATLRHGAERRVT